jgi:diguanylate cyclase (GGDEF)-like protein
MGIGYTGSERTAYMPAPADDRDTTQRTELSPGPRRAGPQSACVVVIHGEGLGKRVDVGERPVVVGRSHESDLQIPHPSVSRQHCSIWRDAGGYRVRDLGSTNRTRVNEHRVEEISLTDGDHITVGETILKFISHASVEARYHEEVYQLATHDALTELYNRRHFLELMEKEIARAERHGRPLALAILDVDLFKRINDDFGHIAGDVVLKQIAEILRQHVRGEDIAARIGGEEFAILLPEAQARDATSFAERLREAVATTAFAPGGAPQRITVSIGLASLAPARRERSELMRAADTALYQAKESGRNRVCSIVDP